MSNFIEPYSRSESKIKVKLDCVIMQQNLIQKELQASMHQIFQERLYLTYLKSDVNGLDTDKLKTVPVNATLVMMSHKTT